MKLLGRLLGLSDVSTIDSVKVDLAAPWAEGGQWVLVAIGLALLLSLWFYLRLERLGSARARWGLGIWRGLVLVLLVLTLAEPVLQLTGRRLLRPLVYVVFDGTESMGIADEYAPDEEQRLREAAGEAVPGGAQPTRLDLVRGALLRDGGREGGKLLDRLQDQLGCELEAFVFDGRSTSQLRRVDAEGSDGRLETHQLVDQLSNTGQVTALGALLDDTRQQLGAGRLAGVVLFSDFSHNAGLPPLGDGDSPAGRLGAPLFAVGVGAVSAVDAAVELQVDTRLKRAERTTLSVRVTQAGLAGESAELRLVARGVGAAAGRPELELGRRTITLQDTPQSLDFPFTPVDSGEYEFVAELTPLAGEAAEGNNRATRRAQIIDDYLRLMYVSYEPTWEWRFVKEVFHRDKLVGLEGFRTFLASSDPQVRQANVLFLPTLTPGRSQFFVNDVLFLGDMPRASLTDRFAELVREFVGVHGGGLVVLSGARYGPRQLLGTALEDMLPVVVDPNADIRDDRDFELRRTPLASRFPFMQLGDNDAENEQAWNNLGKLPFYQPVLAVHPQATVLAEHPADFCRDGKTKQPLIAIRQFGRGQVVFLGFDETWRLRRRYGERYYRRFWSQLIYRLGMSHALGADKRFRVQLNGQRFRAEDEVTLRIEAFDENYEPMTAESLEGGVLHAELVAPASAGGAASRDLVIPYQRQGAFEARFPVYAPGDYVVRVRDPLTAQVHERRFEVAAVSAEQQRVVRDEHLQQELARVTGGRSYDLTTVSRLPDDLKLRPTEEQLTRDYPLWTTPLWFGLLMLVVLGEWLVRKLVHLS